MKKIYKIPPVSIYDITGVEQWLEELANDGLFPVSIGAYATFRYGGKPGTRFRLEPFGKAGTEPSPMQQELYEEAGWEYAFSIGQTFFLFYTTDPAAPELHTDYATRGQSLDRLARKVRRQKWLSLLQPFFWAALVLAAFLLPFFYTSRFDFQPDPGAHLPLQLLRLNHPLIILWLLALLGLIWSTLRDARLLLELHQRLKAGLPPRPSLGPSRAVVLWNLFALAMWALSLLICISNLIPTEIPLERFSRPYIALAELEAEPIATYQELFGESHFHEEDNQGEYSFSILAPVWYETNQEGYSSQHQGGSNVFTPKPENDWEHYAPDLSMTYLRLTIPAMQEEVARSAMDQMRLVNCYWSYEELEYPGADLVIHAREEQDVWQMMAIAKDGRVAVFRYAGREDLADHLDTLFTMVAG